ncbi:tRNA-dihydrouridine(47) synthase [NAD(P)(+)]-like isoform X3 [Asparagus officinalis]|uniref:tRNA-dihydrouridine(47) synthase [NAD(P)(+)]-like isoform X3 n=1 Tax=Asparagus officinalis TaxID=4686 RepID=UPI00098E835A|nr:tRNA-dihydrouridine(47) synthase [NAD(P)(+)]-like isoform X3 [Asparagus officinalis]
MGEEEKIDPKFDELALNTPPKSAVSDHRTPEELVAKAIAPVKAEYLRPPPPSRPRSNDDAVDDDASERKRAAVTPSGVVKEKKSKRQLKRERRQEQKSALNICPVVAKRGSGDACTYGDKCRFSHDLDAFLAQKPPDLEGSCPFLDAEKSCPYGITCRFLSTHKRTSQKIESLASSKKTHEINKLNKDFQRLLWKNKVTFPKADAQLKLLGLRVGNNTKAEPEMCEGASLEDNLNGSHELHVDDSNETPSGIVDNTKCASVECTEKDCLEGTLVTNDTRPLKKIKCPSDEPCPSTEIKELKAENNVDQISADNSSGSSEVDMSLRPHPREKKLIDFSRKLYLAPLTTVGNLPFRRICKMLGADITCGEMAMCTNLLQGQASEWALLRRHSSEDIFGIQICGSYPDTIARTVELVDRECEVDFIDINMGCPIDIVCNKGAGSSLLTKPMRMKSIIQAASGTTDKPITVKVRTGYFEGRNRIDSLVSDIAQCGASAITIHGRSRQQRYSKLADWDYIYQCVRKSPNTLPVLGNGDIFSFTEWNKHITECPELSTSMIARGALIKPWIFTEIKEQRHWDISSGERFNILKDYVNCGLAHWGSDSKGVETTRYFLLEWLSYTYRYIPVGLLDIIPQRLNWRPPSFFGRDDLETLMASDSAADWIRISEMLLGKVPEGFTFAPKHKSNAYDRAENG